MADSGAKCKRTNEIVKRKHRSKVQRLVTRVLVHKEKVQTKQELLKHAPSEVNNAVGAELTN